MLECFEDSRFPIRKGFKKTLGTAFSYFFDVPNVRFHTYKTPFIIYETPL